MRRTGRHKLIHTSILIFIWSIIHVYSAKSPPDGVIAPNDHIKTTSPPTEPKNGEKVSYLQDSRNTFFFSQYAYKQNDQLNVHKTESEDKGATQFSESTTTEKYSTTTPTSTTEVLSLSVV